MKAEINAQKKAYKAAKKALPSKAVTYKHDTLGEMTGTLTITKSVKVLPPTAVMFKKEKVLRPCQLDSSVAYIEIMADRSVTKALPFVKAEEASQEAPAVNNSVVSI
jgi:hypothetical protein